MNEIKSYDLVIFDLDGTLIDNRDAIVYAYREMLKEFNYNPPKLEWIYTRIGLPLDATFRIISNNAGEDVINKMIDSFRDHYIRNCDHGVRMLDGAKELLSYLKNNGFKVGLATTKGDAGLQELLRRMKIDHFFDLAVGLSKEFRPKPDPSMLLYIMDKLSVDRSRTLYVGDTPVDVAAARNANVKSVAVATGMDIGATTLQELKNANPDIMVQNIIDVTAYLY
ncbi:MAG TPA: HAD family hydrolase [Candidatus Baltobacteraceae bacterium]|nr:HAD family hydrolase [Candidatus Baltobacteraceae bacterium]